MTAAAPQGEYVDSRTPASNSSAGAASSATADSVAPQIDDPLDGGERVERNFLISSYELASGLDVIEHSPELFDDLFGQKAQAR